MNGKSKFIYMYMYIYTYMYPTHTYMHTHMYMYPPHMYTLTYMYTYTYTYIYMYIPCNICTHIYVYIHNKILVTRKKVCPCCILHGTEGVLLLKQNKPQRAVLSWLLYPQGWFHRAGRKNSAFKVGKEGEEDGAERKWSVGTKLTGTARNVLCSLDTMAGDN